MKAVALAKSLLWPIAFISIGFLLALPDASRSPFESITPHVSIYHDVVNVGVIRSNGKALLIDSGEGSVLRVAQSVGIKSVEWVLYTHHHRDQCAGAPLLKQAGAKIGVPAGEARFFRDATEFWLSADTIIDHRYNFRPDLFVLRDSVLPDRAFQPGDVFKWEGLEIQVVPTPGHTDDSVSYIVDVDGKKIAFTGDLIYRPGQLWEFYSLQKRFPGMRGDYWGFGGAVSDLTRSLNVVLSYKPTLLVPSHGVVMANPTQAIERLQKNLDAVMNNYLTLAAWRIYFKNVSPGRDVPMLPPRPPAELPAWIQHKIGGTSWYIQAEDRSIFLFDCGFAPAVQELDQLVKSGTVTAIDGVWISHYHDDHVQSVNDLRRRYGTKVYVQKELVDILENPRAYLMPAQSTERMRIDRPLSEGEIIDWKGYKLIAYYFPGQTIYHDGLLVEHDGRRVFLSGDSFANFGIDDYCSQNRNFLGRDVGYEKCIRLLLKLKPDVLLAAHWGAVPFSEEHLEKALGLLQKRETLFSNLFPWDNPNFGLDPSWVRAYPYRQTVLKGQLVTLEARIFNHSDFARRAEAELRAPAGWHVHKADAITIAPHREGRIRLTAVAPANPAQRREVLGIAVNFGERNLGEIAEAIVDYLQ